MKGLLLRIFMLTLTLGAIEVLAYWWMHPARSGEGEPVLTYQPPENTDARKEQDSPAQSSTSDPQSPIPNPQSSISTPDHRSLPTDHSHSTFTYTPLPDLVARSIPSLYCTTGTAYRVDLKGGVTVHCAFFEWDKATSRNVLEAYKHLPEQCMGSNGMTLISKEAPIYYTGTRQRSDIQGNGSEARDHETGRVGQSPVLNPKSKIQNLESPHSGISFDHTVFRDPGGVVVHAFKGTWVSGASNLLGDGLRGGEEQWRQLRWKAALNRFRPTYARVVQGAIRGIPDAKGAWQSFEQAILKDLTFTPPLR